MVCRVLITCLQLLILDWRTTARTLVKPKHVRIVLVSCSWHTELTGNAFVDWTLFAAASLADNTSIRDSFISMVHSRAFYNNASDPASAIPFPATYNPQTGAYLDGSASPAVGAMVSLLALRYGFTISLRLFYLTPGRLFQTAKSIYNLFEFSSPHAPLFAPCSYLHGGWFHSFLLCFLSPSAKTKKSQTTEEQTRCGTLHRPASGC